MTLKEFYKATEGMPEDAEVFISDCITLSVPLRYVQCVGNEIILELESPWY